ncbi:MAG: hypothetical protein R3B13_28475 [Polyangiaceae bacterium]
MSEPVSLRVRRPYASVEEYLEAESWSIDARSMLLIDEPELPEGEVVKFEVVLDDGSRPIRAEGVVYKAVAPRGRRPGGLRVKLKRMGAQTKAFIDRALTEKKSQRSAAPPPPGDAEVNSAPVSESEPGVVASDPNASIEPLPESSQRRPKHVEPPPNRDELLSRLRERARALRAREAEEQSA